ncbi:hypothetical protein B0H17DRAFT_1109905 [Mycena rosella]|uniref:Uncharacterized protein n=1 Tax=Mycena rosella TaxID=1033263 RepID=A0AAD7FMY7_MYCRO|nr:hypothetical protein B0H17DRAFT_1109905 [Mycena rosella]
MFILPAPAHVPELAAFPRLPALWLAPLVCFAAGVLLVAARAFLAQRPLALPVSAKQQRGLVEKPVSPQPTPTSAQPKAAWLPTLAFETLPSAPPRTSTPVARAGPLRRPAPAARPRVEAPLPALYACAPASMAKMIMSRHTYRRPSPPAPAPSSSPSSSARRAVTPPSAV